MNPKQSFLDGPHAKEWENVVESKAFREATERALLKLQLDMGDTSREFNTAAVNFAKLTGAQDFIRILSSIHLKEIPKQPPQNTANLRHDV